MAFEKGKMNFSVLVSKNAVGAQFENSIIGESYSDSKPSLDTPVEDFSAGTSLADAPKEASRFVFGSHFYASTRKKSLKMPRSRLKEETTLALHQAVERNGGNSISRKEKKEIIETVSDSMQDEAQLELAGSRIVLCLDRKRILVEATSASKLDEALIAITSAVPLDQVRDLRAYTPEYLYEVATGLNSEDYKPLSICNRYSSEGIGRDFLTWLWASSTIHGTVDGLVIALTGMIQLAGEDDGTGPVTVILKDGAPAIGAEVNASLMQGKKVSKAEFSIADGELVYKVVVDDEFHFKGFQGPYVPEKGLGDGTLFDGRMMDCGAFLKIMERVFRTFCEDVDRQRAIDSWMAIRPVSIKQ